MLTGSQLNHGNMTQTVEEKLKLEEKIERKRFCPSPSS